jgi:hypothetical protein
MSELVTDYLERALPWRTWLDARWHLFWCPMCRAYYDQMRKTVALVRATRLPGPPPEEEARLAEQGTQPPP